MTVTLPPRDRSLTAGGYYRVETAGMNVPVCVRLMGYCSVAGRVFGIGAGCFSVCTAVLLLSVCYGSCFLLCRVVSKCVPYYGGPP